MRAYMHNVLLVNQISCSRGKERFVCIGLHLFQTHLCDERVHVLAICVCVSMHEPTQEKKIEK